MPGSTSDYPRRSRGAQPTYREEVAEEILQRMADGESLRAICADETMPPESTVRRWAMDDREGFAARYARACDLRAEHLAEELLEIADDGTGDRFRDAQGKEQVNNDVIQRSKLRVDTRRWLLSKMIPRKYGEKIEHVGDSAQPLTFRIVKE